MNILMKYISLLLMISICSCKPTTRQVKDWTEAEKQAWLHSSQWQTSLSIKPDPNMDLTLFIQENIANPSSWEAACLFLKDDKLNELPLGHYSLADDGTYATISEYFTKSPDTAFYEAHKKYIDIQYVSEGNEFIEVTPVISLKEAPPYIEEDDIMFFKSQLAGEMLFADPSCFFVFFPIDAHKPCLKVRESEKVKKIVVKIPVSLTY